MSGRLHAAIALGAALWMWGVLGSRPEDPPAPLPPPAGLEGATGILWGRPLDLHRADPASLEVLPGIGPARAAAIVAERCRRPLVHLGDLTRVHGIGPRTVARLAGWAEVRDPRPRGCEPAASSGGGAAEATPGLQREEGA